MREYFKSQKTFLNEKKTMVTELAGVVFLYQGKILLCYPKNKSNEDQWSIPKGRVDAGETPIKTAKRETFEEIGIKVKKSKLVKGGTISYGTKQKEIKVLHYFIYQVKNLKDIGLKSENVPLKQLGKKEIKDARFFAMEDAKELIKFEYKDLLKKVKNL